MIGDVVTDDGIEYEVVWSGGEGLVAARATKPSDLWEPPKRIYNKTGPYWTRDKTKDKVKEGSDAVVLRDVREDPSLECDGGGGESG